MSNLLLNVHIIQFELSRGVCIFVSLYLIIVTWIVRIYVSIPFHPGIRSHPDFKSSSFLNLFHCIGMWCIGSSRWNWWGEICRGKLKLSKRLWGRRHHQDRCRKCMQWSSFMRWYTSYSSKRRCTLRMSNSFYILIQTNKHASNW